LRWCAGRVDPQGDGIGAAIGALVGYSQRNAALTFFGTGATIRDSGAIRSGNSPSVARRARRFANPPIQCGLLVNAIWPSDPWTKQAGSSRGRIALSEAGLRRPGVSGTAVGLRIVLSSK
jgi:hypothetical protein